MAWVAVDEVGDEYIYDQLPIRFSEHYDNMTGDFIELPKGSIRKLIGKELTFEDDPVELNPTPND